METLAAYASRIAPVIDRVHEDMHRAAAPSFRATVTDRPPHTGLLITLRFVLLREEPVDESTFHLAVRYQAPEAVSQAVSDLVDIDFSPPARCPLRDHATSQDISRNAV